MTKVSSLRGSVKSGDRGSIPSVLRRRYKIDHLPVNGLVRVKVYLGFKVLSINCKRLIKGLMNRSIPEFSTLLYNHLFSLYLVFKGPTELNLLLR
jgi:hypothetical protein